MLLGYREKPSFFSSSERCIMAGWRQAVALAMFAAFQIVAHLVRLDFLLTEKLAHGALSQTGETLVTRRRPSKISRPGRRDFFCSDGAIARIPELIGCARPLRRPPQQLAQSSCEIRQVEARDPSASPTSTTSHAGEQRQPRAVHCELKPRDRIDVQSFIWVVGDYKEANERPQP